MTFRRIYSAHPIRGRWSVKTWRGMRLKDMPDDMRACFEPIQGAMPSVALKGGTFYNIKWKRESPLHDYEPQYTAMPDGSHFVELDDGGAVMVASNA